MRTTQTPFQEYTRTAVPLMVRLMMANLLHQRGEYPEPACCNYRKYSNERGENSHEDLDEATFAFKIISCIPIASIFTSPYFCWGDID